MREPLGSARTIPMNKKSDEFDSGQSILLPNETKVEQKKKVLSFVKVGATWHILRERSFNSVVRLYLKFSCEFTCCMAEKI